MSSVTYNFDGGGGGDKGPAGWGWVRDDGTGGCGGLAPGTTSNVAEYTALTMALHDACSLFANGMESEFVFLGDSMLVVQQVNGNWRVTANHLRPFYNNVTMLLAGLPNWTLKWIPRKQNSRADEWAWKGKTLWDGKGTAIKTQFPRGWDVT